MKGKTREKGTKCFNKETGGGYIHRNKYIGATARGYVKRERRRHGRRLQTLLIHLSHEVSAPVVHSRRDGD